MDDSAQTCEKCGGSGMVLDENRTGFLMQASTTELDFKRHYVECQCRKYNSRQLKLEE